MCVCVTRASARVAGDARAHAGQVLQGVDQPAAPTGQAHSHGAPSFPHRGGAPPQREGTRAARRRTGPLSPVPTPSPHPDPPQDLTTDFGDGIKLIKLVENISEETLGKYHKNPTSRIQKIENINLPIKYINSFVASIGIKNTYSAENIIDQDKQFILGMVWTLILPPPPSPLPLVASSSFPATAVAATSVTLPLPLAPTLTRCGRSSCASRSTSARRAT